MTIGLASTLRDSRLTLIKDAIDAGSGAGKLVLYTATRPATGAAITDQALLASIAFNDPCGTVSGGVLTFDVDPVPQDATADATGTMGWARIVTSADAFVADLSVGTTGSGADVIVNTLSVILNGPVSILSATITEGNA